MVLNVFQIAVCDQQGKSVQEPAIWLYKVGKSYAHMVFELDFLEPSNKYDSEIPRLLYQRNVADRIPYFDLLNYNQTIIFRMFTLKKIEN